MKNPQKGSTALVLLVIIVIILLGVIGWMYLDKQTKVNQVSDSKSTISDRTITPNVNDTVKPKVSQVIDITTEPVSTPSITITSPNGGELLSQNTSYNITWDYAGLNSSDSVTIGFRTSNENVCWAGRSVAGSKSYNFVPSQVKCDGSLSNLKNGGKFKVQLIVEKYADGRGVADTSDNYFTIATQ